MGIDFGYSPWDYGYSPYLGLGYGGYLYGWPYSSYGGFGNARPYYNAGMPRNMFANSLFPKQGYGYLSHNNSLFRTNSGESYFLKRPSYLNGIGPRPLINYSRNYYNRPSRQSTERRQPSNRPYIERSNPSGSFGGGSRIGGGGVGRPGRP